MCIRDRASRCRALEGQDYPSRWSPRISRYVAVLVERFRSGICLLYTSDAADERSSVDLGGRRIIKKKKKRTKKRKKKKQKKKRITKKKKTTHRIQYLQMNVRIQNISLPKH